MSMEPEFDPERLGKWLADICSTEDEEVDCEVLSEMLETVVAVGAGGQDIRAVLPDIALHLDHCPDCSQWYEALKQLAQREE